MGENTPSSEQTRVKNRNDRLAYAAIIAIVIMVIACIAGFLTFTIMVLDAIPFHHLIAH